MSLRRSSSKKPATVLAMLLFTVVAATVTLIGGPADQLTMMLDGQEVAAREVLVKFTTGWHEANAATLHSQADSDGDEAVGSTGVHRLHSRTFDTATLLQYLKAQPNVVYAEPNYIVHATTTPNDPSFGSLWGLLNSGLPGADIHATAAWDLSTGSTANVVGVVDTGIDYTHPDLAANVWSAPVAFTVNIGGLPLTCPAGTHGFNAILNTCDPMDDHNHGTHVSGTIGAVGNNALGVVGVNWTAKIMGLKFLNSGGGGTTSDAIRAIEFAIQAKALTGANVRVLSNSWGGSGNSSALLDEINSANANNMMFVAAAGNTFSNNDLEPQYPASFTAPNVVAVLATDNTDAKASFSNWGPTSVHLGAPGANILSTVIGGGYQTMSGTSMATPHVSGAAALVLSRCPSLDTAGLKANLLANVDPTLVGLVISGGRLNVDRSIHNCSGSSTTRVIGVSGNLAFGTVPVGTSSTSTLTISNSGNSALTVISITYPAGFSGSWSGTIAAGASQPVTVTFTPTSGTTYSGTVTVNANQTSGTNTIAASGTGSCSYSISPTSASVAATSGSGSFSVTTAGSCGWTASTGTSWVHTTSTGAGSGTASYTVDANPGAARSGSITVQGNTFTINQAAASSCSYSISPMSTSVSSGAASGSFSVTTTTGCAWTASPGVSWVHTTSSGSGSGTVSYSIDANTGSARSGSIYVQGSSFSISQAGLTVTPTLTASPSLVNPGGTITLVVANGPGSPTDWVALESTSAPDTSYLAWAFLNGTHFAPNTGLTSATLTFTAPTTPGTYNLRLFASNTFVKLATSGTVTVLPPPPPSVTTGASSVSAGGTITFTVANGPGNPNDWVALFPVGAANTAYTNWMFLNGARTAPSTGVVNATLSFSAPATAGTFEIRLFSNNTYTLLATSSAVTVTPPPPPSITPLISTVNAGGTIAFTVANGPGNANDWLALYPVGAGDTAYTNWMFLNGTRVAPSAGISSATLSFTAPGTAGSYEVRLFSNNSYTKLATSSAITVLPPPPPSLTLSTTTVYPGTPFTVTVANGPGNPTDWLGLYLTTAGDGGYQGWYFLNNSTTPPSAGLTNATVQFFAPTTPGTYNVRFFSNNTFTKLATSATITVTTPPPPSVTPFSMSVARGTPIVFTVANGPANPTDWVALYPTGAANNGYLRWLFLNGATTPPATGLTGSTLQFIAPTTPGTYNIRFFSNNTYNLLAITGTITVF